jgi:chitinase
VERKNPKFINNCKNMSYPTYQPFFHLTRLIAFGFLLLPSLYPNRSLMAQPANAPRLMGYFHNWNFAPAPYVALDQVPPEYGLIAVAFAVPTGGTDYRMSFVPEGVTPGTFRQQMQTLQAQGRKVILSVGGATAPITLNNTVERDSFVATLNGILIEYPFDGLDLNLEGASLQVSSGSTIQSPTDIPILMMIEAVRQLMGDFYARTNRRMLLTMAPETAYVQGGQSAFSGVWGAYLPLIHALRDSIHLLSVQLYNSGSMYGIDGGIYYQGTADFIVAMVEAVIRGFPTSGGHFGGLRPDQVAIALPACQLAAGGGYTDSVSVRAAARYLKGVGPQAGTYVLAQPGGYPALGGMMTWSINWDATPGCATSWEFLRNYRAVFGGISSGIDVGAKTAVRVYPNPVETTLWVEMPDSEEWGDDSENEAAFFQLQLYDSFGRKVREVRARPGRSAWEIGDIAPGIYFLLAGRNVIMLMKGQ